MADFVPKMEVYFLIAHVLQLIVVFFVLLRLRLCDSADTLKDMLSFYSVSGFRLSIWQRDSHSQTYYPTVIGVDQSQYLNKYIKP